jgi:ParB/RepB/Spo0J family partition protein
MTLPFPSPQAASSLPQAVPVAPAAGQAPAAEEREVALADVILDPANLVKHTPESTRRLADSVAAHGMLVPPTVYQDGHRYPVIAGHGRVLAKRLLGHATLRVRVLLIKPEPQQARDLRAIDDLLREEPDPLALGLWCADEQARSGRSIRELAKLFHGKFSLSTLNTAVAMVRKLPEDLVAAIRAGEVIPAVGRLLTTLPDDDAKRKFAALYRDGTYRTAEQVAAAIKAARKGRTADAPASFTAQTGGIVITVTLPPAELAQAAAALRQLAKEISTHGSNLTDLKDFLARKHKLETARQAAAAAQAALNASP